MLPSLGKVANCKVVVTAHYTDFKRGFPVDLATYHKNQESKIELAKNLIFQSLKIFPYLKHISFDSWYAKSSLIWFINSLKLFWYSKLREDRIVIYQGELMRASGLVKATATLFTRPDKRFIDLRQVWVKNLGYCRLVIDKITEEHVVTNNPSLPPEKVFEYYGLRWKIDEFYREAKDNLAFDQFQIRKDSSIKRHWYLVFLAYTFWIHSKLKAVMSKIYQGTLKTLSEMAKVIQNLNLLKLAIQPTNVLMLNLSLKVIN